MIDCFAVGRKIKELRAENEMNQDQLASILFVSRQAISRWEIGLALPTVDNLIELSKLFKVSFEEILCLNEEVSIHPNDIFKGHSREFIVRGIVNNEIQVNLLEVFGQFTGDERIMILQAIKTNRLKVDLNDLYTKLTQDELKYLKREVIKRGY